MLLSSEELSLSKISSYVLKLLIDFHKAELWALVHGLKHAWNKGVKIFRVELDSLMVKNWVTASQTGPNYHSI